MEHHAAVVMDLILNFNGVDGFFQCQDGLTSALCLVGNVQQVKCRLL